MQLMKIHQRDTNRVRLEMKSIRSDVVSSKNSSSTMKLDEWRDPLFVILMLTFLAFWTGGLNVRTYAPRIYTSVGMSDSMAASMTVVLGCIKVISTLVAVIFIDELGRKTLLRMGILTAALGSFLLIWIGIINLDGGFGDVLVVIALSLYVIAYQLSFGPCLFTLGAEMFPSIIRGKMMSFQIIFASLSDASSTEIFSVLLDSFGVTVPFAGHFVFCVLGYLFISTCFVETTEKRPDEIRDELKNKLNLQNTIYYICCDSCKCIRSCSVGERVMSAPLALARRFTSEFEVLPTVEGDDEEDEEDSAHHGVRSSIGVNI